MLHQAEPVVAELLHQAEQLAAADLLHQAELPRLAGATGRAGPELLVAAELPRLVRSADTWSSRSGSAAAPGRAGGGRAVLHQAEPAVVAALQNLAELQAAAVLLRPVGATGSAGLRCWWLLICGTRPSRR